MLYTGIHGYYAQKDIDTIQGYNRMDKDALEITIYIDTLEYTLYIYICHVNISIHLHTHRRKRIETKRQNRACQLIGYCNTELHHQTNTNIHTPFARPLGEIATHTACLHLGPAVDELCVNWISGVQQK